jgi:hypothetical protein
MFILRMTTVFIMRESSHHRSDMPLSEGHTASGIALMSPGPPGRFMLGEEGHFGPGSGDHAPTGILARAAPA